MQNKNNDISDKEIISLFNERSEQAISKTSDKYKNLCFKIADNILNDKRDSEECVSDTWLALWNNIPPKSPNPLKAYICRIVKNLSLKRYEYNSAGKRKSEYEVSLDELNDCLDKNNDTLKQIEQKQLIETINVFLKKLPKEKRQATHRSRAAAAPEADGAPAGPRHAAGPPASRSSRRKTAADPPRRQTTAAGRRLQWRADSAEAAEAGRSTGRSVLSPNGE